MRLSRLSQITGCAAVMLAAACNNDTTGPATLANPQATIAAVAALDSAFNTAALASFGALSGSIGSTAATAALGRAGTIVRATLPHPATTGVAAEAAAVKQLSGLRAINLSPANPQGPVINDTLYGSIYTYDTTFHGYVRSATTGGPTNGVRFILYAINPLTGNIATPLSPVGQTDLLDESVGLTAKLHIIVTGNGGTPTYLDYTAALTFSQTSLVATLDGSLTNALGGGANKTLQFSVNATFSLTTITVHGTYSLNNPAVTITLDAADKQVALGEARVELAKLQALQQAQVPAAGKYDLAKFQQRVDRAQKDFDAALQKTRDEEAQATAAQRTFEDAQHEAQAQAVPVSSPPTGTGTGR
jgi:hypothetical protein